MIIFSFLFRKWKFYEFFPRYFFPRENNIGSSLFYCRWWWWIIGFYGFVYRIGIINSWKILMIYDWDEVQFESALAAILDFGRILVGNRAYVLTKMSVVSGLLSSYVIILTVLKSSQFSTQINFQLPSRNYNFN